MNGYYIQFTDETPALSNSPKQKSYSPVLITFPSPGDYLPALSRKEMGKIFRSEVRVI